MEQLPHPDTYHVRAAQGWLELGDPTSAEEELAKVTPPSQEHPSVLIVKWQLFSKAKRWDMCYQVTDTLVRTMPDEPLGWIRRAQALHFMNRTPEAWDALLPALSRFPDSPFVAYDLACYACVMGRQEEAWDWLQKAFAKEEGKLLRDEAIQDPDLKPFWQRLKQNPP